MKLIIAILLFALTTTTQGLGRVVSYKELQTEHFASIQQITTCGTWNAGKVIGEFRVLKVFLYGQTMLFVDMVRPNKQGSEFIIEHGFSFKEINNDHAEIWVEEVTCKQKKNNVIIIHARAEDGHKVKKFKFRLIVNGKKRKYWYKEWRK